MPIYRIFITFSIPVSIHSHRSIFVFAQAHGWRKKSARKRYKLRILYCLSCAHSLCLCVLWSVQRDEGRSEKFAHKSVMAIRFALLRFHRESKSSYANRKFIYFEFSFVRLRFKSIDASRTPWPSANVALSMVMSTWLTHLSSDETTTIWAKGSGKCEDWRLKKKTQQRRWRYANLVSFQFFFLSIFSALVTQMSCFDTLWRFCHYYLVVWHFMARLLICIKFALSYIRWFIPFNERETECTGKT